MNTEQTNLSTITRFESYLRDDPTNTRLWIEVGDLYHQAGRFDEAQACFEKVLILDPLHSIAISRLAGVCLSQHRFAEAEQLFQNILNEDQDNASLSHNLGLALFYQHKWEEAEQRFAHADRCGLTAPANLAYWARSLHYQEKLAEATSIAQRWQDNTHTTESKGYLALLAMDSGNMAQAELLALETLAIDPSNTDAATVAGTAAIEQQRIEEGSRYFQNVIDAKPDQGRAWLGMGLTHLYESRHEESIDSLKQAATLLPGNAGVLVTLGWVHINTKRMPEAEKIFRQAVDMDRNFAEAHGGLAVSLVFQQKLTEARDEVKRATKLDPKNFGAIYANAILLKLDGRGALAEKIIAKALEQAPLPGTKPFIEHLRIAAQRKQQPPL